MSLSVSLIVHYSVANKIACYIMLIIVTAFTIASLSLAVGAVLITGNPARRIEYCKGPLSDPDI
jgi:hypothetical protein